MAQLPQEEKAKIAEQVEIFHQEKSKLDAEVAKWDDSGNDIIVLAKQMCMIMMEMTDFTRGKGPLKNTSDVINAAKKIAEAGSRMDKLARAVADQCPDSACKQDLLAYLQRIALYCHQLNICSKVKAEVQNLGGELIVSGLDSATSLIQAAKNLMNAVVLTVKASYVASTKYQKVYGTAAVNSPVVSWKMKAPEKKAFSFFFSFLSFFNPFFCMHTCRLVCLGHGEIMGAESVCMQDEVGSILLTHL
uniref:Catenin alpha-2 n=1 Tax=Myotis myotis TaxID=51298 RepID=A0A7J7U4G5_MYOMY|nr:catenin alpha 2 [Myotis myotis]